MPAKYREMGPRLVTEASGEEYWLYEGEKVLSGSLSAVAGRDPKEFTTSGYPYSKMRPGCYDPEARLADMDSAGIWASLCFPSFARFAGQRFLGSKDPELGRLCVEAYNDWMIDEWCAAAPHRYIPLVIVPLWDPALAARELERCAARGVHALAFSENPEPLGLPSIHHSSNYWEPLLKTAEAAEVVLCMHIGSSSTMPKVNTDSPHIVNWSWGSIRASGTMMSWMFSGIFDRMPKLKVALSEGGIGWMPYYLERAQQIVEKQRYWMSRGERHSWDAEGYTRPAVDLMTFDVMSVFQEHVFGCFIDDEAGVALVDRIGTDNVMIETDYPHSDTSWPNSISLAHKQLSHLPPETQYKILRGNAERLYQFDAGTPTPAGKYDVTADRLRISRG